MKWAFVGTDSVSGEQRILLVRENGQWHVPKGEASDQGYSWRQMDDYLRAYLGNYRSTFEPTLWQESLHGYHCYRALVSKVRANSLRTQDGGPADAQLCTFQEALSFRLCPVTKDAITLIMAEEIVRRRS